MDLLNDVLELMKRAVLIGGGLWLIWGVIVFALGLKDKNGPGLQAGIWQIVGGALILLAVSLFASIS